MSDELIFEELQQRVVALTDELENAQKICQNFFENSHSIMGEFNPQVHHWLVLASVLEPIA